MITSFGKNRCKIDWHKFDASYGHHYNINNNKQKNNFERIPARKGRWHNKKHNFVNHLYSIDTYN